MSNKLSEDHDLKSVSKYFYKINHYLKDPEFCKEFDPFVKEYEKINGNVSSFDEDDDNFDGEKILDLLDEFTNGESEREAEEYCSKKFEVSIMFNPNHYSSPICKLCNSQNDLKSPGWVAAVICYGLKNSCCSNCLKQHNPKHYSVLMNILQDVKNGEAEITNFDYYLNKYSNDIQ